MEWLPEVGDCIQVRIDPFGRREQATNKKREKKAGKENRVEEKSVEEWYDAKCTEGPAYVEEEVEGGQMVGR